MAGLLVEDEGSVRTIRLNRPERRNALTPMLMNELTAALHEVNASGARVLVLAGVGESFCAGLDLSVLQGMASMSPAEHRGEAERVAGMFRALWACDLPTIAAVRGAAVAGGMGLATICDFTLAEPAAKFGYTEVRIGFVPALVSAYLSLQVGDKVARGLLLSGRIFDAAEGLRLGIVSELAAEPEARAKVLAAELLRNSPESLQATKRLMRAQQAEWLDAALRLALEANAVSRETDDFREGLASFLEKRPPAWR